MDYSAMKSTKSVYSRKLQYKKGLHESLGELSFSYKEIFQTWAVLKRSKVLL